MRKLYLTAGTIIILVLVLIATTPSTTSVKEETSTTANVTISETINFTIVVNGSGVEFGNVNPGTSNNPAANNPAVELIVGDDTNANVSISLKGTDFGGFGVSNVTYDDDATLDETEASETNLTQNSLQTNYVDWWTANETGTEQTKPIYYWISVPDNVQAGSYQSTFYYQCETID